MLQAIAQHLRKRQDLILVFFMMMTIVMMILPIPTMLMDVLIALNIAFTILILAVAIYLNRPDQFSTFPGIILIGTAFRLAISISTTRLILTEADAGAVIATFGSFVTAGNLVVGVVIFLIITTAQFLVITKGSERVAEVAARFVLDALPGRQMSIDAEMRAGDISPEEAKFRRRQLDRENQFYGAMDGAMKFVKGDAIAALIIVAVNLLGGVAIGMLQHGMPMAVALDTYSRLTIGDGLVAQIPALFMSLSAGTVVTRVITDEPVDLGADIARQLVGSPRAVWIAAVTVGLIGLVPGFPSGVFFVIAAVLCALGLSLSRNAVAAAIAAIRPGAAAAAARVAETEPASDQAPRPILATGSELVRLNIGSSLRDDVDDDVFFQARSAAEAGYREELGIAPPAVGLAMFDRLAERGFDVNIEGVPVYSGVVPAGSVHVEADQEMAELAGLHATAATPELPIPFSLWIPAAEADQARTAGFVVRSPEELLMQVAVHFVKVNIEHILGFRDMQVLMNELNGTSPEIVEQISQTVTPTRTLEVLRRLAVEGVPLGARRILFETLLERSAQETDTAVLVEHVRRALRRQICHSVADQNRVIFAYVVEPDLEQQLRSALRQTENGTVLALSGGSSARLLAQMQRIRPPAKPGLKSPVVVTAVDIRRHLASYLAWQGVRFPVLSFQEIASEFFLQPIGTLTDGWEDEKEIA